MSIEQKLAEIRERHEARTAELEEYEPRFHTHELQAHHDRAALLSILAEQVEELARSRDDRFKTWKANGELASMIAGLQGELVASQARVAKLEQLAAPFAVHQAGKCPMRFYPLGEEGPCTCGAQPLIDALREGR